MLSHGDRLPSPDFCPVHISSLIQQCFLENPNDRPRFDEIMDCIKVADEDLKIVVDSNENHNRTDGNAVYAIVAAVDQHMDDKMRERYNTIRSENKIHQRKRNTTTNYETLGVTENLSSNASSRNQCGRYVSLEQLKSPDSSENVYANCPTKVDEPPTAHGNNPVLLRENKHKQQSAFANNDNQRVHTYSCDTSVQPLQDFELTKISRSTL